MDTLIKQLVRNAATHGAQPAIREKERGIWHEITWSQYADAMLSAAAGLEMLGIKSRDAMLVLGDNRSSLYCGMLAIAALGGYAMPAYSGATTDELRHFVSEVNLTVALAEDQEHVDKVLELRAAGAQIETIIYCDERGFGGYTAPGLISWQALLDKGAERLRADPRLRQQILERSVPDDAAIFLHSSGTTGKPKGITISHRNYLAASRNALAGGVFQEGEEAMAYLPIAWAGDYALSMAGAICSRFTINIPERQETMLRDVRDVAPTFFLAPPRNWDNMLTTIQVGLESSTRFKRWIYQQFMDLAIASEQRKLKGEPASRLEWLWRPIGELVAYGPIKDQFGLTRLRNAFTGGEAIGEDTFVFYRALGIKLRQLYGQTENSFITATQSPDEVMLHTVGRPLPGVEITTSADGEIMVRAASVFSGYFNNPDATATTLVDGWLRTGDAGYLEADGQLVVLGRIAEVVHTAGGTRYVPNYIENRLKFSSYIKDVAVIGAGRDHLVAILSIDFEAVGHWAEVNSIPYASYADLSQRPEVAELLQNAVRRVNNVLPQALRVVRFVSLHKEFDPDDGEITRTRKLRRNVVESRYEPVIDALYSGDSDVRISATVSYENGQSGTVERTVRIWGV
ncbi:AMP-dependent synthetase/ligase [Bosea sp. NPDC055594]